MSAIEPPPSNTEAALKDAYLTLKNSKEGPGKKEQTFDNLANAVSSAETSPSLVFLNNFYTANSALIGSAAAGFASLDNKTIDAAITGFSESVKVVMDGLDALGAVHPFVGVAVIAFKLVVTLDLTRRGNNQKVLAVKVQMQQMMCTLFQLRRIQDPEEIGPDGTVLKDRMQPLMEQIARDIKECGSACDVYLKKSFIAKTLKSKIYEGRLAGYASKFIDYRDQLDKALTVHIALGVDAANLKLDSQSSQLDSIEEKLDILTDVFRRLDTPREKEVMEFIEESGGPNAIVERNDLVLALVDKSGETLSNLSNKARSGGKSELDSVREKLQKEVAEDLDAVLKQNFALFDRKLEIQNRNIMDAVKKEGQYIVSALSAGSHDRIRDTDLQNLWREMGWKGSVKARHFVLALRDYFTDQFSINTPHPSDLMIQIPTPETAVNPDKQLMRLTASKPILHQDLWALQYINVSHLNAILEAIDDDGTGFISIKEANTFANERPRGWGLLTWIAFWSKGWESSLADYKNRIILILQEMDRLHHDILADNTCLTDLYLSDSTILGTHLVLKSTDVGQEYDLVAPELLSITREYTTAEEERLKQNLESIGYDLDTPGTVTLITGPGRIERYLFPLLFLVLKRHLEAFYYARKHIVSDDEFSRMTTSLNSIFDVVRQRIDSLRAIYKQVHMDSSSVLKSFSLGMFYDYSTHDFDADTGYGYGPEPSLIMSWEDTSTTKNEATESAIIESPESAKPLFSSESPGQINALQELVEWPRHSFDTDPYTGRMDGFWTGHLWITKGDTPAPFLLFGLAQLKLIFDPENEQALRGHFITYLAKQEVQGRRRMVDGVEEFDVLLPFDIDVLSIRLVGKFVTESETLEGGWLMFVRKDEAKKGYDEHPFSLYPPLPVQPAAPTEPENADTPKPADDAESKPVQLPRLSKFIFRRTPTEVGGFCRLPEDGMQHDAKSRWRFLRDAVLHLVRSQLWSQSLIRAWCADRHKFLDLYTIDRLQGYEFSLPNPLGPDELPAFHDLRYRLPPSNINPSVASATWTLDRMSFHYSIGCDGCEQSVLDVNFTCLTCIDPEMSNSFDFCPQCIDKPAERDGTIHTVDHTLIKCRRYTQPYTMSWQIREARSMTERLKKALIEASTINSSDNNLGLGNTQVVSSEKRSELQCSFCTKPVTVPCWACITCAPDILICEDCEKKGASLLETPPAGTSHRIDHPLIRLHNLLPERFEQEKVDVTVARIDDLETSVGKKVAELDTRIANLESTIEAKLASFESLLKKIALQLDVPQED
ncbi:hypothetical protein D9756_010783 [Leucocoprinus leucothites]|uniref:EF-hand domain-containing protein n=1 Tax=Leucocoprinus leucothites TaxID=201217 RepID=A0A8H5CU73_9AGAR|nr:hypothetical protein D9756_010783 [Leucoagaricus leucothites]